MLILILTVKSVYGKHSKIVNTSYLPKRSRQTGQTQIRLLLKMQSDQGLPCCFSDKPVYYSDKQFVNSSPETIILFENRKKQEMCHNVTHAPKDRIFLKLRPEVKVTVTTGTHKIWDSYLK